LESYHSINWFSNATPNLSFRSSQTSKQIAEFLKNTYESHDSHAMSHATLAQRMGDSRMTHDTL